MTTFGPPALRVTVRVRRGYRVLRRVSLAAPATVTRPPIVVQLPALLGRLWHTLFPPLSPEGHWARARQVDALDNARHDGLRVLNGLPPLHLSRRSRP